MCDSSESDASNETIASGNNSERTGMATNSNGENIWGGGGGGPGEPQSLLIKSEASHSSNIYGGGEILVESLDQGETVQRPDNDLRASGNKNNFITQIKIMEASKIAPNIIPQLTGENMSVTMFMKHYGAAAIKLEGTK